MQGQGDWILRNRIESQNDMSWVRLVDDESFIDYYNRYKDLLDKTIPKEVLGRLLGKAKAEPRKGDAWEPPEGEDDEECPF